MHRKSSSQQTQENAAQLLQSLYVHSLQVLEAVIKQSAFFFFFTINLLPPAIIAINFSFKKQT